AYLPLWAMALPLATMSSLIAQPPMRVALAAVLQRRKPEAGLVSPPQLRQELVAITRAPIGAVSLWLIDVGSCVGRVLPWGPAFAFDHAASPPRPLARRRLRLRASTALWLS